MSNPQPDDHLKLSIQDYWRDFKTKTINPNATERQLLEMKAAFFAGAISTMNIVTRIAEQTRDTDIGMTQINRLYEEVAAFMEREL